jgi:benzoyl-CoA reductase subunit B
MTTAAAEKTYPTEPLKTWGEAKYLRAKYYQDFLKAPEIGGLRVSGSGTMYYAILGGLGKDVYVLTGEPYAATCAYYQDFSTECMEATEKAGVARDLCGYLRNYWGGVLLDKYILTDGTVVSPWPRPNFFFTSHYCCTHAKWYQWCQEAEGGLPMYGIDVPWHPFDFEPTEERREYIVQQCLEAIPWLEKVSGRKFDDELMVEAIHNEARSSRLWAEICTYNQVVPAPLDEKTMFSLYVFNTLCPHRKEIVDFYERLLDEVKDRVRRGIAAWPTERFRYVTDSQPPWSFLHVFRYLEREFGAVSVGSIYTFTLQVKWDFDEQGNFVPAKTPQELGAKMDTREDAIRAYVDFKLKNAILSRFYSLDVTNEIMKKVVKQWKAQAVLIHLNRGCEGTAVGQMENRLALVEEKIPVLTFEGNMGDHREFDLARTTSRIDSFFEALGVKRLKS